MSRRILVYAALVITSAVVTACADATAPRGDVITDTTGTCRGGFVIGTGKAC